jgi:hypothetical protein
MPYTINRTNGLQITVVQDGTIDTKSLDITLVGKNYTGYGEAFNENFVKLLENFSNNKQPVKPLSGQLWYDSVGKRISVYNGTKFRPLGVVISSSTRPATTDSTSGDLWWDTANKQLNAFNGSSYVTIGPMNTKIGNTGAIPSTALNSDNNTATPIIKDTINSTIAFVSYAGPHFNVDHTDDVYLSSGISFIQPGITLSGSDATFGVSVTDVPTRAGYMLWGTAASALRLVRSDNISHSADEFLLTSELAALQGQVLIDNDDGLIIGKPPVVKFHITRVGGNNIANASVFNGSIFNINANTTAGGSYTNIVSFDASNGLKILPNSTTPVTIGTAGTPFDSVHVRSMYANTLTVSTFIYDQQEIDSVTLRASGMSYANTFSGSGANLTNIPNTALVNSGAVQVLASTGLTGGGNVAPGGSITITNVGVTSLVAGTDITINRSTGTVTVTSAATLKSVTDLGATTDNIVQITNGTIATSVGSGALQVTGGVGITGNLYVGGTISGNASSASSPAGGGSFITSINIGSQSVAHATSATSAGNLTGGSVTGSYTLNSGVRFEATYADLAERYAADAIYEPGTVLVIGGSAEVTTTTRRGDTSIAGIVSTNPAYTLNATAGGNDTHPYIALKGRVPCKVIGPIKKGDLLITSNQAGYAQASTMFSSANAMLGRALQDFNGITGVIEVMVI